MEFTFVSRSSFEFALAGHCVPVVHGRPGASEGVIRHVGSYVLCFWCVLQVNIELGEV